MAISMTAPVLSPVNPAIRTNIQDGDTITFDAFGMVFFDANGIAMPGQTMGSIGLKTSWGMDTQGSTSGSTQIEAGTYLFRDPYYTAGEYSVVVTTTDEKGHSSSRTVRFTLAV